MEIILRNSSIYGFLFGLALSILFIDYKEVTNLGDGGYVTTYKPVIEYIVSILRSAIIGMFLGLFIGWTGYERKHKTQGGKTYYLPFFFIVFIVSIILMYLFNW